MHVVAGAHLTNAAIMHVVEVAALLNAAIMHVVEAMGEAPLRGQPERRLGSGVDGIGYGVGVSTTSSLPLSGGRPAPGSSV
jgi:hypothetical protein